MNKIKIWLDKNQKEIFAVLIVALILGGLFASQKYIQFKMVNETGIITKDVQVPKVANVQPKCSTTEVNYILKNTDSLMQNKNWFVINLDDMMYQKDKLTTSKETHKPIYGVWRKLKGKKRIFLVIYEDVENLDNNIKEYQRHVKKNANKSKPSNNIPITKGK